MRACLKTFFEKKHVESTQEAFQAHRASRKHVDLVPVAGDADQRITRRRLAARCAAQNARAEIERITTFAGEAWGADPRAHANERDEKEARHSSFNYKFH